MSVKSKEERWESYMAWCVSAWWPGGLTMANPFFKSPLATLNPSSMTHPAAYWGKRNFLIKTDTKDIWPILCPCSRLCQCFPVFCSSKIFRKINISYPLLRTRSFSIPPENVRNKRFLQVFSGYRKAACAHQGVKNVTFSENFAAAEYWKAFK